MTGITQELMLSLPLLVKAVFSQPTDESSGQKVSLRPIRLKNERVYQAEILRGNKAFHRNISSDELPGWADENLDGHFRQVLLQTETENLQYILKRDGNYKKTGASASIPRPGRTQEHNRRKEYILAEGDDIPALVDLGIFTADHKIVKARYDKYRQINRFVELVAQEVKTDDLKQIRILDFGCGKSYLTFILYYYFAVRCGLDTCIIGYDLKEDVVERCNEIAARYGYTGLRFETADVAGDALAEIPADMIVTLHACDTATDYALAYAMRRKARYIFSVPCCQHEVNLSIRRGGELDLLLEHGIIRERVCALLTDAIRSAVLEDAGYEVDMIEFIDFEHSPKNIMIRARYTGLTRSGSRKRAEMLREKYGFRQKLLELTETGAS